MQNPELKRILAPYRAERRRIVKAIIWEAIKTLALLTVAGALWFCFWILTP